MGHTMRLASNPSRIIAPLLSSYAYLGHAVSTGDYATIQANFGTTSVQFLKEQDARFLAGPLIPTSDVNLISIRRRWDS